MIVLGNIVKKISGEMISREDYKKPLIPETKRSKPKKEGKKWNKKQQKNTDGSDLGDKLQSSDGYSLC